MDVRALADEDLIPLMARGDARAFEAIYERHSGAAYSLAYRMVGTRVGRRGRHAGGVPEPVALRRALRPRARLGAHLDPRDRPSPRDRRAAPRVRALARRRSDDETAAERLEAPERVEEDVARRDEAAIVRNAMEILPADQLKVIELAYFGGFTHVEIAEMLEQPVGTVKGRMRLGLKKMREALAQGAVG